jgi:cysteine desulfurase
MLNASDDLVYLDHAASTPMRAEAVAAMMPFFSERFANPSGSHRAARASRQAVDEARDMVAECLGAQPGEVIFTGCGTESDSLAINGILARNPGPVVTTAIEHHAVLHAVEHHGGAIVGVDATGVIDMAALEAALTPETRLVSVMLVNNEVGTIQPMRRITRLVSKRSPLAAIHTDAIQAINWVDVAADAKHVHLLSISAHKFGGPKGVGALVVRKGTSITPQLLGGGQERDLRSGTHNVAGIVAMAVALQLAVAEREVTVARITGQRDRLLDGLLAAVPDAVETVPRELKVAGSAHICFPDVENEALLYLLDRAGLCASAASACASGAMDPSHVLAAMGVRRSLAGGALRLSLGVATTDADIDRALAIIPPAITRLRRKLAS